MRISKCATAVIAVASVLAFAGAGLAATPSQADFDACNKEAQAKGGTPAASPGTKSDTGAGASASGGTSVSGGASGTTGGGASASADAQLQGMAAAGQNDPAYQQAYRDCMKGRGFETCRDGQEGFRTAAESVKDPQLKQLFMIYSQQRAEFISELQAEILRLGGDPDRRGTVAGALLRGWMNIRSAISGGDDRAIVAEAERGEDAAKAAYEDALQRELSATTRPLVERQYARIKEAHDRVRALRERAA